MKTLATIFSSIIIGMNIDMILDCAMRQRTDFLFLNVITIAILSAVLVVNIRPKTI